MGKTPSDLRRVQERMRAGAVSMHGFLGTDKRPLARILQEDDATVRALGLTHSQIAERLAHFTEIALRGYGTPMKEGDFEVVIKEVRGRVQCPFGDLGHFRKGEVRLTDLKTGKTLLWSPLVVHMIGEHGFYEGERALYRVEPEEAKEVLGL